MYVCKETSGRKGVAHHRCCNMGDRIFVIVNAVLIQMLDRSQDWSQEIECLLLQSTESWIRHSEVVKQAERLVRISVLDEVDRLGAGGLQHHG